MLTLAHCAACAAEGLDQHFSVAGDAGPEGLIPSTVRFGTALADRLWAPDFRDRMAVIARVRS
jgi:hypothetical protein